MLHLNWFSTAAAAEIPAPKCLELALTGHNYLNYHRSVLQESLTDKCRFCGKAREEFVHLARESTALMKERAMLHKYGNISDPQGFRSLLRFILMDHIEEAMSPTG